MKRRIIGILLMALSAGLAVIVLATSVPGEELTTTDTGLLLGMLAILSAGFWLVLPKLGGH